MRFSKSLKRSTKKHNSAAAWGAKVDIRERVLDFVGEGQARVFDAFAGAGKLHDAVWSRAAAYQGCDTTLYLDGRTMFCADNRRVLPASISDFSTCSIWTPSARHGNRRASSPRGGQWRPGKRSALC